MSNCGSRPKKMKYGGKVKKMEAGGSAGRNISDADRERVNNIMGEMGKTISDADREALNQLIGEISSGKKKKKMPSGPIRMPKAIKNMRARRASRGGAGEAGPAVTRYKDGGAVCRGMGAAMRGGKFSGVR